MIENFKKITPYQWEISKKFREDMKVNAQIFATEAMLNSTFQDRTINQLVNVTTLPGVQNPVVCMPDAHEGYGFPIGGVAATEWPDGAISPGGIGYDINCGVRLLISNLTKEAIKNDIHELAHSLYREVPSGVGRSGRYTFTNDELYKILRKGVPYIVDKGFGKKEDIERIESNGVLDPADPDKVSQHALDRGRNQLGTMGAGNHFVEIGYCETIFDEPLAKKFNLFPNQVTILIHTGSRGLGHQVATDYLRIMNKAMERYNIHLVDRELTSVPFSSNEGQDYFKAMNAAANFAFVNRQIIGEGIRRVFQHKFKADGELQILYDVAHNIAKIEEYEINSKLKKLIIHRKGATRAFPGQPVLIPGSMGTSSYVLCGNEKSLTLSWGSTCHGAGRAMSRHAAKKKFQGSQLYKELINKGIDIEAGSIRDLSEEAPLAYKDVDNVVEVVSEAELATKVARLKPLIVVKG